MCKRLASWWYLKGSGSRSTWFGTYRAKDVARSIPLYPPYPLHTLPCTQPQPRPPARSALGRPAPRAVRGSTAIAAADAAAGPGGRPHRRGRHQLRRRLLRPQVCAGRMSETPLIQSAPRHPILTPGGSTLERRCLSVCSADHIPKSGAPRMARRQAAHFERRLCYCGHTTAATLASSAVTCSCGVSAPASTSESSIA